MKKRVLLFSGQGAQKIGMGQELYAQSERVRELYHQADALLKFSLSEFSFHGPESQLTDTSVCQPALYVHGIALLEMLREADSQFRFDAVAGLSLGEYTAHAAAGTFDFQTGLNLVYHRGRLMREACATSNGGMISLIGATHEVALAVAKESGLEAANFNCPGQVVLSGASDKIPAAIEIAKREKIRKAIPLQVAGAYHSRLMTDAQKGLQPFLDQAKLSSPQKLVIANFTASPVKEVAEIRETLSKQVCGSVRWEESMRYLIAQGYDEFLELGPGGVLTGLMKRINPEVACYSIGTYAELKETQANLVS